MYHSYRLRYYTYKHITLIHIIMAIKIIIKRAQLDFIYSFIKFKPKNMDNK